GVKNLDLLRTRGAPYPRFPVELIGFRELHAPFLKERRTSGLVRCCVQEIRGISLVFREMWGATVGRPFTTWTDTNRSAVESHISRKTSEIPRISCTQHRTR